MEIFHFRKTNEIKKSKLELEEKLNVEIQIKGKNLIVIGDPVEEYEASIVLDAINFGFSTKKALTLKDENIIFRVINIKNFTRKKNLRVVRGRVIGKEGKTLRTIQNISNAHILVKENEVGIIGSAESIEEILTGITNLIRGSKQSNTYRYLEKLNKRIYG